MNKNEYLKPRLSIDNVKNILYKAFNLKSIINIEQLSSYSDQNFKITCSIDDRIKFFTLKVLNSNDSKHVDLIEAENRLMKTLASKNIKCPTPIHNLSGREYFGIDEDYQISCETACVFLVRLLNFIEGLQIDQVNEYTKELLFNVGQYAGRLNQVLMDFHDPIYEKRDSSWHLDKLDKYSHRLENIDEFKKRKKLQENIEYFLNQTLSTKNQANLQRGLIHGDLNETNILVTSNKDYSNDVTGIVDFGDCSYSYFIFEVAICALYMMLDAPKKSINSLNQLEIAGHVIAGYTSVIKLNEIEFNLILDCIKARIAQSLMNGCYANQVYGDDGYVLITQQSGWNLLCFLEEKGKKLVYETWSTIIRDYEKIKFK